VSFALKRPRLDPADPNLRLAGLALTGLLFLLLGYLSAGDRAATEEPPLVEEAGRYVRGTIESISGDRLTLATETGVLTVVMTPDTRLELLRRGALDSVQVGETVNVGSVPHAQTLFVVVGIVIIPTALVEAGP
jgi:hypothetical protein